MDRLGVDVPIPGHRRHPLFDQVGVTVRFAGPPLGRPLRRRNLVHPRVAVLPDRPSVHFQPAQTADTPKSSDNSRLISLMISHPFKCPPCFGAEGIVP